MTRARDISNVITNADLAGDIDVDGTANLDVVDIDGAVDMASTLTVAGAFTSPGIDDNADATAITIDSGESVFIGNTAEFVDGTGTGDKGIQLNPLGLTVSTRNGGVSGIFGRQASDGAILQFRKDGSSIGQINADGGRLLIASSNAGLRFDNSNSAIFPRKSDNTTSDNLIGLGLAGHRFTSLYLSDGVYVSGTADGNKLDHYEEGTWTPQLTNGSSNIGTTVPSGYNACFTRIGNSVHAEFYIQRSDTSSDTNPIVLAGLPYAHKQIPAIVGQCWIDNSTTPTFTDIRCFLYLPTNYQQLYFIHAGSNNNYVTFNEFENGRYMYAAFDYLV